MFSGDTEGPRSYTQHFCSFSSHYPVSSDGLGQELGQGGELVTHFPQSLGQHACTTSKSNKLPRKNLGCNGSGNLWLRAPSPEHASATDAAGRKEERPAAGAVCSGKQPSELTQHGAALQSSPGTMALNCTSGQAHTKAGSLQMQQHLSPRGRTWTQTSRLRPPG